MFPMMLIAILIKLTSRGPVFYKQLRVGMDQKEFKILKFRTMSADAEKENGPQWTGITIPGVLQLELGCDVQVLMSFLSLSMW
jgi:lipopolysaccharide/colanic/teichoic acid biosynthesis glycosyltransferase